MESLTDTAIDFCIAMILLAMTFGSIGILVYFICKLWTAEAPPKEPQ